MRFGRKSFKIFEELDDVEVAEVYGGGNTTTTSVNGSVQWPPPGYTVPSPQFCTTYSTSAVDYNPSSNEADVSNGIAIVHADGSSDFYTPDGNGGFTYIGSSAATTSSSTSSSGGYSAAQLATIDTLAGVSGQGANDFNNNLTPEASLPTYTDSQGTIVVTGSSPANTSVFVGNALIAPAAAPAVGPQSPVTPVGSSTSPTLSGWAANHITIAATHLTTSEAQSITDLGTALNSIVAAESNVTPTDKFSDAITNGDQSVSYVTMTGNQLLSSLSKLQITIDDTGHSYAFGNTRGSAELINGVPTIHFAADTVQQYDSFGAGWANTDNMTQQDDSQAALVALILHDFSHTSTGGQIIANKNQINQSNSAYGNPISETFADSLGAAIASELNLNVYGHMAFAPDGAQFEEKPTNGGGNGTPIQ